SFKGDVVASGDDHGPSEIRYADVDRGWVPIGGADSGEIQLNQCNTDYAYGRDVYSRFMAVKTNDTTYVRNSNTLIDAQYKYLSQDPDSYFAFYPSKNNVLKKSIDNMKTSVDLYTFTNNITKVEVALKDNNKLFVLENRIRVHKSINGGTNFVNITPSTAVTNGQTLITDIEIDETGNKIWLAYGNSQTTCKVVYSSNGGTTWTNITNGNLPSLPLEHITYQRGTNGMVYVAMKRQGGIWYKDLSMPNWLSLGSGLPMISYITSIYTVPDCGKLRMGTSRGAFEHALPVQSEVQAHFSVDTKVTNACYLDTTYFYDYSSYYGPNVTFQWSFEGGTPSSSQDMNPKVVYLEPGIFDVTLVVTDGNGNSSTYTR
ncbi:MAG TPA: PKD domain-containing protein, partial [Saprospiraceae bacterium]|nr:PKD domain-containing protein [Saprospiraceae bacterium]